VPQVTLTQCAVLVSSPWKVFALIVADCLSGEVLLSTSDLHSADLHSSPRHAKTIQQHKKQENPNTKTK